MQTEAKRIGAIAKNIYIYQVRVRNRVVGEKETS